MGRIGKLAACFPIYSFLSSRLFTSCSPCPLVSSLMMRSFRFFMAVRMNVADTSNVLRKKKSETDLNSLCIYFFLEKLLLLFLRGLFHFVFAFSHILQPKSSDTLSEIRYSQGPSTLCECFAHVHSSLHYNFWRTVECFLLVLLMGTSEFVVELYAFPEYLLFLLLFAYLSSSTATYLSFL
jgi:hypothetical protein